MKFQKLQTMYVIVGSIVLSGCGNSENIDEREVLLVPPIINQAKAFEGPLSTSTQINAERYIKNGIYAAAFAYDNQPAAVPPTVTNDLASPSNFSTTNTAELGVDESDRMEYDGNYMYLATYSEWVNGASTEPKVKVMQRNEDFSLTELSSIGIDFNNLNIEGLYLHGDRLTVISADYPISHLTDIAVQPWNNTQASIGLSIHDVSDPANTANVTSMEIDGTLLSSRRIDNQLYIVSAYTPFIAELDPSATSDTALLANYNTILSTPASAIMPKIRVGQQAVAMNDVEECYIPADATESDGHAQLITVTKINLETPTDRSSMCLSAYAFMSYTSQDNMYIASNLENNETQFHKISLTDLQYQASGKVEGAINARANPHLRIDEKDGHLRVVSTVYSTELPTHKLTILNQDGDVLQKVSELPNETNTESIGKPGEDIYAVRFIDDKAYVVTFLRIDPLYVIDLSDQQAPYIAGSLEIPGFSSYLQPLKNNLILGVGQSVDFARIPLAGAQPTVAPTNGGMKISLFDARDPANPIELTSMEMPNTFTPVEFNYKALTVLENNGAYRFAVPTEEWQILLQPGSNYPTNRLLLLETDTTVTTPALTLVNTITVENDQTHYIYSGDDRSVLHDDAVYYIHGNQIWLANWLENASLGGPF